MANFFSNKDKPYAASPVVQALQILFNRSPRQLEILKGQEPAEHKYGFGDSIENKLSQVFVGYADISQDRVVRYRDYDRMDLESTESQTALDIYAEEAAQVDSKAQRRIWVTSEKKDIDAELNGMLDRTRMEYKAYGIYRNIAKYGDCFLFVHPGVFGVHDTFFVHPSRVERVQDDGLLGYKSTDLATLVPMDNKLNLFKPWDFIHFRILAYDRESIYGRSILESLRKIWKQLSMLETMIVLYRIAKSVQRNIFYVDVGQASGPETTQIIKEYEKFLKNKTSFVDPKTKEFRLDFNPATMLQDIVWPTRSNSASKVEYLQNTNQIGPLEDLDYFRNKMRSGLGIPKDYFDGEPTGAWNAREALMLQDVRFSRKVKKLQDAMHEGVVRLCQIHWAITHGEYLDAATFQVNMGTISDVADRDKETIVIRKGQALMLLAAVADAMGWNKQVWSDYLLDQIFPLPPELRDKLYTPDPSLLLASKEGADAAAVLKGASKMDAKDLSGNSKKSGSESSYIARRGRGSFMAPGGNILPMESIERPVPNALSRPDFDSLVESLIKVKETADVRKTKANWIGLNEVASPPVVEPEKNEEPRFEYNEEEK